MQQKHSNKKLIWRSVAYFRPFWKYFALVALMMAIGQAIAAFSPYMFGRGVDAVIAHDGRMTAIFVVAAFLLALIQAEFLVWIRETIEVKKLDEHIGQYFSAQSLERMFRFSIGQHTNEHSGVKQTVVNRGQNALSQIMYTVLYNILPNALQILVTLTILTFFDWRIAITAAGFAGMYIFVSYRRNKRYFPKMEAMRKKNQDQSKLQSEFYRNATLVIGEAQEDRSVRDFKKSSDTIKDMFTSTWLAYLRTFFGHKLIVIVGQYACLGAGIYLIFQGDHSPGMFVTLFAWLASIFGNLVLIMNTQRQFLFQSAEIKKFYDLLDIVPDIDPNEGGARAETFMGAIEFKNVKFSYPYRKSEKEEEEDIDEGKRDQDNAIEGITFSIPAGAKVGFVGKSGSGKSTIVNLIRRYYDPTEGSIHVDGIDLKKIDLRWLRSHIGNVEQKIDLFDRSIRDNILFGLPADKDVSDKDLQKAVQDASLDEFIKKLKDHGLDTMIGENGIKVSGGERQRIGIARALIKNPKIMIFDEATSALDAHNEKLIHEAINRGSKGRTTIIVAHRLSTIADADKIFVVDNGHIVGEGTHTELAKSCPEYKELIKHQVF